MNDPFPPDPLRAALAAGEADAGTAASPAADPTHALWQRRLERERAARKAAEELLTAKSRELNSAVQQAREAERQLQLALWANDEGIWEWRAPSPALALRGLLLDGRPAELADTRLASLFARVHAADQAALRRTLLAHVAGRTPHIDAHFRLQHEGRWRWLRARGRALERNGAGRALWVTGTLQDVTAQHDADEVRRLMAHAFASTLDALVVVDARWQLVQANEAFGALLGCDPAQLPDTPLTTLLALHAAPRAPAAWHGEALLPAAGTAEPRVLEVSVSPVGSDRIGRQRFIVALRDISERRRAQQAMARMALTDPLTGLANRAAINSHLQERVQRPGGPSFGLMFMDLDGFKAINDSHGHRVGDELLVQVADGLRQVLPEAFIGRWGGDEFVVVLPDGSGEYLVRDSAQLVIAAVSRPLMVGSDRVAVTPSIGAVFHPDDGADATQLLQRADAAMYAAKAGGRNGLVLYQPALDEGAQRLSRLHGLLRADAERSAFGFVVQPKVDAAARVVGAELLMRWQTEAFGAVSPAEFIPLAEQIGVIHQMGRQALHAAARLAAELRAQGCTSGVAVNLSPQQLLRPDLERIALRACEQHHAEPSQIELELTESALVSDVQMVQRTLVRLRRHGFRLALDDFGTGYSSLSHLRKLPFHKIKLDRSFVMDIDRDPRALLMVQGVVQLCASLGLATVAEGVETERQFELLRDLGIQEFQGYLFSRPQPREQWLESLVGPPPSLAGRR